MGAEEVAKIIRDDLEKGQIIDVAEEIRANRKAGGEHALAMGLRGRGARRIAGLAAYELNVQRLAELTEAHGGLALNAGCFPGTKLRNYKPLQQYGRVLLGFASIDAPGELPASNITHTNGATLNYRHSGQSRFPGLEPEVPDEDRVYAIIMTVRDPSDVESIAHMAVGVIEQDFSGFILYEELDAFLETYDSEDGTPSLAAGKDPIDLRLKEGVKPFVGGEVRGPEEKKA